MCLKYELPGCALPYTCTSSIDKAVGLSWALWLIAGPSEKTFRLCCSKVLCICTDLGNESNILDQPDIVKAFFRYLNDGQICSSLIDYDAKLFPLGVKIAGFSHILAGLMQYACNTCDQWPRILDSMRSLTSFFKNATYIVGYGCAKLKPSYQFSQD